MNRGGKRAFTIMEVIVFVAISGLLLLIAVAAVGSRQREAQFTDSMRSLHSFLETQYSAALNGVNDNPVDCSSSGGNSVDCVNLGRAVIFSLNNPTQAQYFTLTGERLSADDEANCPGALLVCADPTTENFERNYQILWQSKFTGGKHRLEGAEEDSRAFGFVRDPRSSLIMGVSFRDQENLLDNVINSASSYSNQESAPAHYGEDVSAYYCFSSAEGDRRAVITLIGSQVSLVFDPIESVYSCT